MAATPFDIEIPGQNLFDIYTDGAAITGSLLPGGGCNFVDTNPGSNGAKCGCRRFWTRTIHGSPVVDQTGFCMCNHHACYHDETSLGAPILNIPNVAGQENEKPRTGREPLSPVVDLTSMAPPAVPGFDFQSIGPDLEPLSFIHNNNPEDFGCTQGFLATPRQGAASIPDTLSIGEHNQVLSGAANTFPPIPSQCLLPSQTTSTTSSVQARYLRPFSGKGLGTLTTPAGPKSKSPLKHIQRPGPEGTSTSKRGSPECDDSFVFVTPDEHPTDTPMDGTATQAEPRAMANDTPTRTLRDLSDTVQSHDQRIDRLENVSFSVSGHDDCHEKGEVMDARVTDLELRVEEMEKLRAENPSLFSNDREDAATDGGASVSTSLTSRALHSQDLQSRLLFLEAEVTQLRRLMPSMTRPWEIEVVLLPFPLKRLWQDVHQFKSELTLSGDNWTQQPMTHSTATLRSQSPANGDWATAEHDAEWLFGRACSNKSLVDKRLRSRGLIQSISVSAPDARSVHAAMHSAFGNIFREMGMQAPSHSLTGGRTANFLGLSSTWVPLRKVHKDSRLRFLSQAEMVTPTSWDIQFLNTVLMRSTEPRLFITHPDAYLQDLSAYDAGWTWQTIRQMTRVHPDVTESQDVAEADALEECWAWNDQLDEPPSANTSMSLRQEKDPGRSSSQTYFSAIQGRRSSSPFVQASASPLLKGRRASRPPHIRTASVPITHPAHRSPATTSRRVASYGQSRHSSPSVRAPPHAIVKTRRTRSPSHHRFTPRWTASPSPVPLGLNERHVARGTTPMAYATPYSNAPLQEVRAIGGDAVYQGPSDYANDDKDDADGDFDIQIYESGSEELYSDGDGDGGELGAESVASDEMVRGIHESRHIAHSGSQRSQLPEDEPWPGIEDQRQISDGENVDPELRERLELLRQQDAADRGSDVSSEPSEYPSTQRAWPSEDGGGFRIHVDDDA